MSSAYPPSDGSNDPHAAQPDYGPPEFDRPAYGQPAYGEPVHIQPPAYGGGNMPPYGPPSGYGGGHGGGYGGGSGGWGGPPPPNYLVWAILTTIFCCWPLSIPSIVFAAQVNSKHAGGDFEGARRSSKNARNFAIWSAVVTVLFFGGIALVMALTGAFNEPTSGTARY